MKIKAKIHFGVQDHPRVLCGKIIVDRHRTTEIEAVTCRECKRQIKLGNVIIR